MRFVGRSFKRKKNPRKKKLEVTSQLTGGKKVLKLRKTIPYKCTTAKRICIRCQEVPIHKLAKEYDGRICRGCLSGQVAGPEAIENSPKNEERERENENPMITEISH
jgi:hypothetical protein